MAYQPFIGYLMPNLVYTYLVNIYDLKTNSLYVIIFEQARVHWFVHNKIASIIAI